LVDVGTVVWKEKRLQDDIRTREETARKSAQYMPVGGNLHAHTHEATAETKKCIETSWESPKRSSNNTGRLLVELYASGPGSRRNSSKDEKGGLASLNIQ